MRKRKPKIGAATFAKKERKKVSKERDKEYNIYTSFSFGTFLFLQFAHLPFWARMREKLIREKKQKRINQEREYIYFLSLYSFLLVLFFSFSLSLT